RRPRIVVKGPRQARARRSESRRHGRSGQPAPQDEAARPAGSLADETAHGSVLAFAPGTSGSSLAGRPAARAAVRGEWGRVAPSPGCEALARTGVSDTGRDSARPVRTQRLPG